MSEFLNIKNMTVCRAEPSDFAKYGFDKHHYNGDACKSSTCFMFYLNGEVCGFVAMLSHTSKGLKNAMRMSRIVVLPEYRDMGVGVVMELFLGSLYTSIGKVVYNCCHSKAMGKYHQKHQDIWHPTAGNRKKRNILTDNRYQNRVDYLCYRHRYDGAAIQFEAVEELLAPISKVRANGNLYKHYPVDILNIIELLYPFESKEFISDFLSISIDAVINKYGSVFPVYEHTPIEKVSENVPFVKLPENYVEIRRYSVKIEKRELAKKQLYINAILRRSILPSITFDHLLFCLIVEANKYVKGGLIDRKDLLEITRRAMLSETSIKTKQQKTFIVNDAYCLKYGMSRQAASNMARKKILYDEIAKFYDIRKTEKQNLQILQFYGINVSIKTLQRWRKEVGIAKYKKGQSE